MVIMTCAAGMGDAALRDLLPRLWRRIEDAHYSYLETDDSPEKLQQKKKLEDYIMEYLARAPHECKFRLAETNKVFQRTVNELVDFNAHRAGVGWAAVARYAGNLLTQPWRKEYRVIRLYSGFYKHEVEANMVGAERLLHAMGYSPAGAGRLALLQPVCPDTAAAVSRDALVAHCECRIMLQIWETIVSSGANVTVSWGDIYRARAARPDRPAATAARLIAARGDMPYIETGSEIYSNVPTMVTDTHCRVDPHYHNHQPVPSNHQHISPNHQTMLPNHEPIPPNHQPINQSCHYCPEDILEDPMPNIMHPQYVMPQNMVPQYMYSMPHPEMPQCSNMMTQYLPYYYPVQAPYMIPTPVYPSIKHAATVPVNGYPPYRYPAVPTAQLIELEPSSVYENNNHKKLESSRRNSTSKSGFSDVTLPSLPRSDTQPALSKAREDGMGTYESWDYVFRNLSNKEDDDSRNRYSPSLDRDSRTLDRLDKAHKNRYQPTTLDLEDGLQALSLDHRVEELKKDLKKSKQTPKRLPVEEKKAKRPEPVGNPAADGLITSRITPDKIKLLTKKEIKDRKEVVKQQNSVNGNSTSTARAELKKVKKPAKVVSVEIEKPRRPRPFENGTAHSSKSSSASSVHPNFDLKAQLVVSLDESDSRSPPRSNGDRPHSRNSTHERTTKWECATCTYINKNNASACEMCGKSKMGPEIQPLTSGGKECPACTLVNQRDAKICDACGTNLEHCPTYI